MKLYEMTETARQLYALLSAGEIDEQTVADTMEAIGAEEKLESYVYVQKTLEAELAAFKAEKERICSRIDTLTKQIDRMKAAQIAFMQATNQRRAKAGTFTIALRESEAVCVTDESAIPAAFWKPQPAKLDKAAVKAALKAGEAVAGAALQTNTNLIVR